MFIQLTHKCNESFLITRYTHETATLSSLRFASCICLPFGIVKTSFTSALTYSANS